MKLAEVQFRETVNEPGGSTPQFRFQAKDYGIEYAEGVITVTGSRGVVLVPLSNVRFMTPAPKAEAKK